MLFSLIASIGLAAILAYVFLPTLFYYEQLPKGPQYELAAFQDGSSFRIVIVGASLPGELGDFEVLLAVDSENHTFGPLPEGIDDLVTFFDDDGNGILDVGDYFLVEFESGNKYRLLILPVDRTRDEGVGFTKWPA